MMRALPTRHYGRPVAAAAILATAALAACAPMHAPPEQVEASPPRVSYTYGSDADLVEANRKAQVYCTQYSAMPSMDGAITENPDGTRTVTFRCLQTAAPLPPPPAPQPMNYTYRTDAELLRALQSADAYCRRNGQAVSSNITTNANGTKSLTFQCIPG